MEICGGLFFLGVCAVLWIYASQGGSYGIEQKMEAAARRREMYIRNKSAVDLRRDRIGKLEKAIRVIKSSSAWSAAPDAVRFARAEGLLRRAKSEILYDYSENDITRCAKILKSAIANCHRELQDQVSQILAD